MGRCRHQLHVGVIGVRTEGEGGQDSASCFDFQMEELEYMPGHVAAQRLGLSNHMVSRITGTVLILRGSGSNPESRANIGLNLKFTKRGEEVPGYTKKTEDGWLYSGKCLEVINGYLMEWVVVSRLGEGSWRVTGKMGGGGWESVFWWGKGPQLHEEDEDS